MPSLRLIRFAKWTALVADIVTVFCAFLIVGWQIIISLREGVWQTLPLSFVFNTPEYGRGEIDSTASIDKMRSGHVAYFADVLLQVPIIVPLLLAAIFLTAFYLWLSNTEDDIRGIKNKL